MVNLATSLAAGAGVAVTAYTLYSAYWWFEIANIEKPRYTVLKSLKGYKTLFGSTRSIVELRHYEPYLIAEATVTNEPLKKAMGAGFWKVAKFIFGGNKAVDKAEPEKIAMTSPVRMTMPDSQSQQLASGSEPIKPPTSDEAVPFKDPEEGLTYKISFVMPRKYTKETLPVPDSDELNITMVPAHDVVAIMFNGPSPSPKTIESKRLELLAIMKENDITQEGDVMVYQYHPPFAPNFLRVNEVLYMVKH